MAGFCCYTCGDELEEYAHPSNSAFRHCLCLRFFFHQLFSGYTLMFQRIEGLPASSPTQGTVSLASGLGTALPDTSINDSHLPVARPVSYDPDQRFSRLQRDGLVSRREKSMTHFQEHSQALRRNTSGLGIDSSAFGNKWTGVDREENYKLFLSESSDNDLATKSSHSLVYVRPSSEDEDVCPTCLDDYTPENPKITTKCSHHFHLGCIYEWLERSESCPICGKEMEFCESP